MLLESFSSIFSMTYLKQHIKYFLFRRKIQLDLPVVFFYPLDVLHTEWSNRIETAKCNRLLNLRVKSCLTTLCNPHTCSSNQHSFVNEVDSTKYTITPTDNVPCIHDIMCSLLDTSEAAGGNEKKIFFEYFALCLVHAFMLKYLLRGCDSGDLRGWINQLQTSQPVGFASTSIVIRTETSFTTLSIHYSTDMRQKTEARLRELAPTGQKQSGRGITQPTPFFYIVSVWFRSFLCVHSFHNDVPSRFSLYHSCKL